MLAGLLAGSATTITSNPLWVIQTTQAVRTLPSTSAPSQVPEPQGPKKKLGFLATIRYILRTDGLAAFWRGIGPALVLVVNPILQYTVFEQLKNALLARRLGKLRVAKSTVVPALSSLDYFLLGALSKLGKPFLSISWMLVLTFLDQLQRLLPTHTLSSSRACNLVMLTLGNTSHPGMVSRR